MKNKEIRDESLIYAKERARKLNDIAYRRALRDGKDIYERIMITSGKYNGIISENCNVYTFEMKYVYITP